LLKPEQAKFIIKISPALPSCKDQYWSLHEGKYFCSGVLNFRDEILLLKFHKNKGKKNKILIQYNQKFFFY